MFMEVCRGKYISAYPEWAYIQISCLDVHIRNTLVKLYFAINQLSIDEFYELYSEPDTVQITNQDRSPLPSNIPAKAVVPLYLGKRAEEFTLDDTHVLLSKFGESFNPTSEPRRSENCHTPLAARPLEASLHRKLCSHSQQTFGVSPHPSGRFSA